MNHAVPTPLSMRLFEGERLLWSALPDLPHTHFARLRFIPAMFLLIIATALLVQGIYGVAETGTATPGLIALFSFPFFTAAYGISISPIRSRKRIRESIYGISNQRVIIANRQDGRLFRAIALDCICGIQRWERKNGFAALEIETNGQANKELVFDVFMLDGLSEPDRVEQLLVNLTGVNSTSSTGGARALARQAPV
jgi:hypothetical protein